MEHRTAALNFPSKKAPAEPLPQVTAAELKAALNFVVRDSLLPVSAGLSALYAVFAISHALVLPDTLALPMSLLAGATALLLLMIRLFLRRSPLPERWAHPMGAVIIGLILVNSLLHLYLTAEPIQTTNLILLVIGAGFLYLSLFWLGLVLLITFSGWVIVMLLSAHSPEWTHFGFALFTASVLAMLIHFTRVRSLKRLEALRFQEERRKAELETALAATDEARRGAEISKRELMQSEAQMRLLTSQMPAILWTTDAELRFTSSLGTGLNRLDLHANQVVGMSLFEFFQTSSPDFLPIAMHYRALKGESVAYETEWNGRLFDSKTEPLRDAEGQVIGLIGIALDITDRKHAEEQARISLKEKELLLKEIHNRVKNNLQVISSLLHLQAGYIQDAHARARFKESQDRLKAIVLIHEKLYQSEDLTSIDFGAYIRNLVVHLFRSHQVNANNITPRLNVDPISLDIDRAVPCGLIINELVANALQYAFPNGAGGEIGLEFHEDADKKITLAVSDNGIGLSPDLEFRQTESLGFQLVNTLVEQIHGAITLERHGGTKFTIAFRH
ncbi:MAG: hypothetical protein ALAOOOJD_00356 [bacterium]|nr:hypothetical protein [bacterium]